jgi:hypothetical protein
MKDGHSGERGIPAELEYLKGGGAWSLEAASQAGHLVDGEEQQRARRVEGVTATVLCYEPASTRTVF